MNINELIERLKKANERYAKRNVTYCVDCDKIAEDNCCVNHTIIYKDIECNDIEEWIRCLEYVRKNLIEFIRFSSSLEKN